MASSAFADRSVPYIFACFSFAVLVLGKYSRGDVVTARIATYLFNYVFTICSLKFHVLGLTSMFWVDITLEPAFFNPQLKPIMFAVLWYLGTPLRQSSENLVILLSKKRLFTRKPEASILMRWITQKSVQSSDPFVCSAYSVNS